MRFQSTIADLAKGPLGVMLMRLRAREIEKTRILLAEAGRDEGSVAEVFVAQFLDALGFGLIGYLLGMTLPPAAHAMGIILVVIGAFIGWVFPTTALANVGDARKTELLKALPFAIDLLVSAIRSGLDFGAAVRYYVNLGDNGPLTAEFTAMLRETELGTSRITALKNMAERVRVPSFTQFVSAVALGTEMGSSLSDTMEIQGDEMRKARFSRAEILAQKAPSKMILPMALFIMPAVFIIIFTPVYIRIRSVH